MIAMKILAVVAAIYGLMLLGVCWLCLIKTGDKP
jgi:hypothetical protein